MKNLPLSLYALTLGLFLTACQTEDPIPWQSLSDTDNLDNWTKRGGEATYRLEDGLIIGTTVSNTPNTFLCTNNNYRDFILEYEVKLGGIVNSGVQFRSNSYPEHDNGRVHGYQCEIDPSERSYSAGIYDEARRGWLYPLDENPDARAAFKKDDWNHFRIEAHGDTIRTWINGVAASHLLDNQTPSGFIGLQVHSIGQPEEEGIDISWRNIRILTEDLATYQHDMPLPLKDNYNQLTYSEEDWNWQLLWDGASATGWRGAKLDSFPQSAGEKQGWRMEDGILTIYESGGGESESAGDIITIDTFSNFHLKVDFRITPGANSGIKYFVDPELNKGEGSAIGLEYQILDDELHPDAKLGNHEGSRTLASLYDLIKAGPNKAPHPIGEWNHAEVISRGLHVEHWLNGRKVLEYDRRTPEFRQLVQESKYEIWPGFGEWPTGHLLLQDHGNTVSFRNLFIKTEF